MRLIQLFFSSIPFAGAAVSGFLYASLVEYCLHRFLLHESYEQEHVKVHHKVFQGRLSYATEEPDKTTVLSSWQEILRNIGWYLPIAALLFVPRPVLGVLFFSVCMLYNLWEEVVHYHFHKKSGHFIHSLAVFRKLNAHHRIHHNKYKFNYGIGTVLWDWVFRTKKEE